jgi:hypothetical protein
VVLLRRRVPWPRHTRQIEQTSQRIHRLWPAQSRRHLHDHFASRVRGKSG